jgi:N-acetylmuramoyl-L-alanine amidase
MAVMPGAHFLNAVQDAAMARYDVVCVHTIVGHPPANAAHFSTRADGYVWQSRDTRYRSAANYNGNPRVIAIENEDMGPAYGAWNTNDGHAVPGFTAAQVESIAQICAWANRTHGIPLVLCPDSKPGSRGIGYHREGIDSPTGFAGYQYGGRVSGGEVWTTSPGKVCPGDRRITQVINQIIPRARQIAGLEHDMTPDELLDYQIPRAGGPTGTTSLRATLSWLDGNLGRVLAGEDALKTDVAALNAKVESLQLGGVDVAALAAALKPLLTADLVKAVNDDADLRARDNNPNTGPRS